MNNSEIFYNCTFCKIIRTTSKFNLRLLKSFGRNFRKLLSTEKCYEFFKFIILISTEIYSNKN